uniref:Uncharacterized protein n=1 Tax=Siphoviridae sp. ctOba29 TaxID=2825480 RepID=A0A8S5NVW0_9CAUD|nr:MAG TPA: hypothetical protein [Siphoviridae sp. ctOba29]
MFITLHLVINGPVDKCVHAFPSALCMGLNGFFTAFGYTHFNFIIGLCIITVFYCA